MNFVHAEDKGRFYYEKRGDVVWEVATEQKVIALTFDDGPDPVYTPQILDLLKQHRAKATFFVLGSRVEQYPDVAKREVLEGHELANHTYGHPGMRQISEQNLLGEIEKAHKIIKAVSGKKLNIFRPPGGVYNEKVVNTAKAAGYIVVMWSWNQDTRDWSNPGVRRIVDRVVKNAHNGGIVLFHDTGGNRSQTVAALEQILIKLEQEGYRFVTVSELLQMQTRPALPH
ncbi:polysaccharide deacetylase family protein [Tumebacillus lipolyticus]|uniref:Polysaccharide deacetylase family protein n=1 Tax=Tumebacillus lipolyticus TaxID=1280370 RepID=A0ABW4ZV58_9BACL